VKTLLQPAGLLAVVATLLTLAQATGSVVTQDATPIPSLLPVEGNPYAVGKGPTQGRLVRQQLTQEEMQGSVSFCCELYLQNAEELQAHIDKGHVLTEGEIGRYLPSAAAYANLKTWLINQGFTVTLEARLKNTIFAAGTVAQAAAAFRTEFGRVATNDGEFTSALVEPSLPADLASSVRAIRGLQPHLRRYHSNVALSPQAVPQGFLSPQVMASVYGTPAGLTGAGQTIAVVGDAIPLTSDLVQFWNTCGIAQSAANVTVINIQGGPGNSTTDQNELSLDVEWTSGIAPGACIRIYAAPAGFNSATEAAAITQILNDLPDCPSLHVVSESFGGPEGYAIGSIQLLAAQGVTYFASSGDYGSNPNYTKGGYDPTQPATVEYPASDNNVTGVGGTELVVNSGQITSPEEAWGLTGNSGYATGGGLSTQETRPLWQTGTGVPSGTMRCVPDVGAMAFNGTSTASGAAPLVVINGSNAGMGGTSLATPVWAGLCAIVNQSLAQAGLKPTGALNAKIYPLLGTGAFNGMTSGSNGAYTAGIGYNMLTGLGSPNVANLIAALEAGPPGLSVKVNEIPQGTIPNGNGGQPIILTALATGSPTGFQWYLNGTAIPGANGFSYTILPTAASEGTYSVVVTNANGSTSALAGTLGVSTNAWLTNLSARAYAETGANELIAGFVTTGTGSKAVLVRGDGPSLAAFSITGYLTDPQLTLLSGSSAVASASSWSSSMSAAFAKVGAFSLPAGSHDAALLETLAPGPYTAQVVSSTTNSGVALAEVYDADSGAPTDRLINLSARAFVGTGTNILIGGFVIGGSTPQTVIIRGDGPSLSGFGLSGALSSTTLTLSDGTGTIATNSGWSAATTVGSAATGGIVVQPLTAALSAKVGAFALAANSNDSAIVATLPPGAYTAQLSGSGASTGVGLVEIYELR